MTTPKFKPMRNRVLILPEPVSLETQSGIILSDDDKLEGKIGKGTLISIGSRVDPEEYEVGKEILYSAYVNTKIKLEGVEYIIAIDEDIYGSL